MTSRRLFWLCLGLSACIHVCAVVVAAHVSPTEGALQERKVLCRPIQIRLVSVEVADPESDPGPPVTVEQDQNEDVMAFVDPATEQVCHVVMNEILKNERRGPGDRTTNPEPSQVVQSSSKEETTAYWGLVREAVASAVRYPPAGRWSRRSETVVLRVVVGPGGALVDVSAVGCSGDEACIRAAIRAVKRAAPFPQPPAAGGYPAMAELPVRFESGHSGSVGS